MSTMIEAGELEIIIVDGQIEIWLAAWAEEPFTGDVKLSKEDSEKIARLIIKEKS